MGESSYSSDQIVEVWKLKNLIKTLQQVKGNGTSMISLIIPPKYQISLTFKMLVEEFGAASNIKSRVNRQSVLSAITSIQQRLRLYPKVPPNGLVIYWGNVVTEEGEPKKMNIDFEPFRPIKTSIYQCGNKFHTKPLEALLVNEDKFGFIVIDGNGTLFGRLAGDVREVLHKFSVQLPSKHNRGGQSALRFERHRAEKRYNYMRKVAEMASDIFLTSDKPNIVGLILAGSADLKNKIFDSDLLDSRLRRKVIKLIDVAYGEEQGFYDAIKLASDDLQKVKFIQETTIIDKYFDEIANDTKKYTIGVEDSISALEQGVVETIICWENLNLRRCVFKVAAAAAASNTEIILHLTPKEEAEKSSIKDKESGLDFDRVESQTLLEWLANNYKSFGAKLTIITDRSQVGSQFVHGFGGIGCVLRYSIEFESSRTIQDGEINETYDYSEY